MPERNNFLFFLSKREFDRKYQNFNFLSLYRLSDLAEEKCNDESFFNYCDSLIFRCEESYQSDAPKITCFEEVDAIRRNKMVQISYMPGKCIWWCFGKLSN